MTSRPTPQCLTCDRWVSPLEHSEGKQTCTAYPAGIPTPILDNQLDHRMPYLGDRGLTWTPRPGFEFPQWALTSPG